MEEVVEAGTKRVRFVRVMATLSLVFALIPVVVLITIPVVRLFLGIQGNMNFEDGLGLLGIILISLQAVPVAFILSLIAVIVARRHHHPRKSFPFITASIVLGLSGVAVLLLLLSGGWQLLFGLNALFAAF